tara:strand:+ start:157 stop:777 length:621 start_codon:yes stop_codon:yes gene_type:complete
MKTKLVIFDLDGVLINSLPNMIYSWNIVRKKFNIKNSFSEYYKFIGLDFFEILENLKIKKKYFIKIKKTYSESSIKEFNKIKLYPNVKKTLLKLSKQVNLAILTSKDSARTKKILNKLLPEIKFKTVQSPIRSFRPKPFPDLMFKTISENNVFLEEAIFVGDSKFDLEMAKKSKVKFVYAKYGYSNIKKKNINSISSISSIFKFII